MQQADHGKKALALGGGGAKGAYEIGVWQALREKDFAPEIVTGTSIGSINSALVAQGDMDIAVDAWKELEASNVLYLPREPKHTVQDMYRVIAQEIFRHGGADQEPLRKMLEKVLDEKKVRASGLQLGVVTVHFPSMRPVLATLEAIPEGQLIDYLLASSACFPAFKQQEIGGELYIDGGYYDNVPIGFAYDLGGRDIVAVDLEAVGFRKKLAAEARAQVRLRKIRSAYSLGSMLIFDAEMAMENIRLGYLDTKKLFGEMDGRMFSFHPGTASGFFGAKDDLLESTAEEIGFPVCERENTPLQLFAQPRRMFHFISKIWGSNLERWQYALAVGEMAGLNFAMDPKEIYAPEEYHDALLQRMYRALHREKQGYESMDDDDVRMQDIARGMLYFAENASLDAADIALYTASPVDLAAAVYMRSFCFTNNAINVGI